jgi:23S rRNA pseudouridine1911/1915/1917 synthase
MTTYNEWGASEQGDAANKEGRSKEWVGEAALRICLESSGVVGVIKPAGIPTQAPPGIDSLEQRLRSQLPRGAYLGVPHRLDRAVSGVMLFAVTPRAARQLSRQFERRQIAKTYLALTEVAAPPEPSGDQAAATTAWSEWIDWVAKIPDQPQARIAVAGEPGSRQAETAVRRIGDLTGPGGSSIAMLHLEPRTGRMHQLRVQAAARGMPIVGDALYGAGDPQSDTIALHAWRIAFTDPDTQERLEIEAPLPEAWPPACREFLATAGLSPVTRWGSSPSE